MMRLLREAGLSDCSPINRYDGGYDNLPSLSERVKKIFELLDKERPATNMIFFVMYDITSDKVRKLVAKYLLAKGCTRVQKSIFLADLPSDIYRRISDDLTAIQSMYDNSDSILVVPLSVDYVNAMRIIGQNISLDLILKNKSTLFF